MSNRPKIGSIAVENCKFKVAARPQKWSRPHLLSKISVSLSKSTEPIRWILTPNLAMFRVDHISRNPGSCSVTDFGCHVNIVSRLWDTSTRFHFKAFRYFGLIPKTAFSLCLPLLLKNRLKRETTRIGSK